MRHTSLDELPQLFNILKGEMSLVGPRPERPFFVEKFRARPPVYGKTSGASGPYRMGTGKLSVTVVTLLSGRGSNVICTISKTGL